MYSIYNDHLALEYGSFIVGTLTAIQADILSFIFWIYMRKDGITHPCIFSCADLFFFCIWLRFCVRFVPSFGFTWTKYTHNVYFLLNWKSYFTILYPMNQFCIDGSSLFLNFLISIRPIQKIENLWCIFLILDICHRFCLEFSC